MQRIVTIKRQKGRQTVVVFDWCWCHIVLAIWGYGGENHTLKATDTTHAGSGMVWQAQSQFELSLCNTDLQAGDRLRLPSSVFGGRPAISSCRA